MFSYGTCNMLIDIISKTSFTPLVMFPHSYVYYLDLTTGTCITYNNLACSTVHHLLTRHRMHLQKFVNESIYLKHVFNKNIITISRIKTMVLRSVFS